MTGRANQTVFFFFFFFGGGGVGREDGAKIELSRHSLDVSYKKIRPTTVA